MGELGGRKWVVGKVFGIVVFSVLVLIRGSGVSTGFYGWGRMEVVYL